MKNAKTPNEVVDELVQKAEEKTVEKLCKSLLEILVSHMGKFWVKGMQTFYAPHIKVLSKLLVTELKYEGLYRFERKITSEVRNYREDMQNIVKGLPKIYQIDLRATSPKYTSVTLMNILDAWILGSKKVLTSIASSLGEVNRLLEIEKPRNLFDVVFGRESTYAARNDLCSETLDLVEETEKLIRYRNEWARVFNYGQMWPSLRAEVSKQCPSTPF